MDDDDHITLADAAAHFRVKKNLLLLEGHRGKLAIYLLGKSYYTTPKSVREWIEKCRVYPKAHGSISTRVEAVNGKSETDHITFARAALNKTLSGLKNC